MGHFSGIEKPPLLEEKVPASLPLFELKDSYRDNPRDEEKCGNQNVHEIGDKAPALPRRTDVLVDLQCILLNTACTVVIVFINKFIFTDSQLRKCQVSLAAWHFTATAIVLFAASRQPFNIFKAVEVPVIKTLPISAFFTGFLLLGNLSLAVNPVGFYQLAKTLTTPAVVLLNFLLFRKTVSYRVLASVVLVCFGVVLTNSRFVLSNQIGTVIAIASFTVTALYQIWIGKMMGGLHVSAPQLLLRQAVVSVPMLLVIAPFVDVFPKLSQISPSVAWGIFGSGVVASLLNLSQFLIIGRTSALTFNVISQIKTIIIISASWYLEGRFITVQEVCGVSLAIGGAYAYAVLSNKR